jgi:hypothetical protein
VEIWAEQGKNLRSPRCRIEIKAAEEETLTLVVGPWLTISGRIFSRSTSLPVPGALVQARGVGDSSSHKAQTLEDGIYVLEGLKPTTYLIRVSAEGFGPMLREGVAGGAEDVDFAMEPPGVLKGRASDKITGVPLERFRLELVPVAYRLKGEGLVSRTVDGVFRLCFHKKVHSFEKVYALETQSGRFEVRGLSSGRYYAAAEAEGYEVAMVPHAVRILPEEVTQMDVALVPARSMSGRVLDATRSDPIQGARIQPVYLKLFEPDDPLLRTRAVLTDQEGRFQIDTLVDHCAALRITHNGYRPKRVNMGFWGKEPYSLRATRAEGVEKREDGIWIRLDKQGGAGRIAGSVRDGCLGTENGSTLIGIQGKGGVFEALCVDEKGCYQSAALDPGNYTVYWMAQGRIIEGREAWVRTGETTHINFGHVDFGPMDLAQDASRKPSVKGVVYSGPDLFSGNGLVVLEGPPSSEPRLRRVTQLKEGTFSFYDLENGSGEISFWPHSGIGSDFKFFKEVKWSRESEADLLFKLPETQVRIHVLEQAKGTSVPGVLMKLWYSHRSPSVGDLNFRGSVLVFTDQAGSAHLKNMPPGECTLLAHATGFRGVQKTFKILEYGTTGYRVELEKK